jgi:AcrR family transcriptional regulator
VAGATEGLERLHRDLQRWIDSYRVPDGVQPMPQRLWGELGRFSRVVAPRGEGPSLLPRGRSALPEDAAGKARRERVFDATALIAAREGYAAMTVARIAEAARIPRSAFYSHFDGKADAILATQTHGVREAMAVAAAEYSVAASWPQRVWSSLGAFLTNVAEKPDYARLDFIESFAAGPPAIRHRQQNQMAFALFLEDGYRQSPDAERLPRVFSEAVGGAVFGLMRSLVVEGKADRLLSLRPAVAYTVLAPFIGPQEAGALVQAWARGAR